MEICFTQVIAKYLDLYQEHDKHYWKTKYLDFIQICAAKEQGCEAAVYLYNKSLGRKCECPSVLATFTKYVKSQDWSNILLMTEEFPDVYEELLYDIPHPNKHVLQFHRMIGKVHPSAWNFIYTNLKPNVDTIPIALASCNEEFVYNNYKLIGNLDTFFRDHTGPVAYRVFIEHNRVWRPEYYDYLPELQEVIHMLFQIKLVDKRFNNLVLCKIITYLSY